MKICEVCGKRMSDSEYRYHNCEKDEDDSIVDDIIDAGIVGLGLSMLLGGDGDGGSSSSGGDFEGGGGSFDGGGSSGDW